MGEKIEITLPKLGESITEAIVVTWLKKVGDHVNLDEALVEVSTDKVNSEIPSPVEGILVQIFANIDEEIEVGAPLALIEAKQESATPIIKTEPAIQTDISPCPYKKSDAFSPAVLRLAQLEGISMEALAKIEGSGERGRLTKKDVTTYLASRDPSQNKSAEEDITTSTDREKRVKLTGMRKAIADNMVRSFYEAPHASLVYEADVTDVMTLIKKEKVRFFETHGVKLTITTFLMQALVKALQQFPMLNASLEDEMIILKRYINIGVAVHIDGGLVVPVIKNCQERNTVTLAKELAALAAKARDQRLAPDDVKDGSVTLTNFGMTGALLGTPIIRYPEVAIIGAGTIQKRPIVRDDDSIALRQMMYLTLTFDHRIIDGIYGCNFLAALKNHLESV